MVDILEIYVTGRGVPRLLEEQIIEIVKAARKGDDESFYQLIDTHKDRLFRIAYAYLHNEQDALEAIQETTFRAYVKLRSLRKPEYFRTWLIRILINYCNDELKRRRRQSAQAADARITEDEDLTEHHVERIRLEGALDSLEPKLKQIVILKYFEDLTIREIAKVLRRPDSTVKTWLYKALVSLNRHMRKEE
jgi:RNA polymerase sigma-70 factor (ECF subfamily)